MTGFLPLFCGIAAGAASAAILYRLTKGGPLCAP